MNGTMMIQTTINKLSVWLILIAVIMAYNVALAISPQLNSPRIGDRLIIKQLRHKPVFTDSLRMCPDFSNVKIESEVNMQVWPPAPTDSISDMVIFKGRMVTELIKYQNGYQISITSKPGITTHFSPGPPYGVPDSLPLSKSFNSSGHINDIGNYTSTGNYNISQTGNHSLVTIQNDTIFNVECLTSILSEKVVSGEGDEYLHHGMERHWYAPGYRYPLAGEFYDVLLSVDNDTIDTNHVWQIIETPALEDLPEDPVNEYLRAINFNKHNDYHDSDYYNHNEPNGDSDTIGNYIIRHENNMLIVTPGHGLGDSCQIKNLMLCDIQGRVYQYEAIGGLGESATMSLTELPQGVYLLYIESDCDSLIYRFKN